MRHKLRDRSFANTILAEKENRIVYFPQPHRKIVDQMTAKKNEVSILLCNGVQYMLQEASLI